jgi:hypothetical protein
MNFKTSKAEVMPRFKSTYLVSKKRLESKNHEALTCLDAFARLGRGAGS